MKKVEGTGDGVARKKIRSFFKEPMMWIWMVFSMTITFVHSQVCNNTCGAALVYNNRCDEEGVNPLCLPGTDCADCQMLFPVWQIVISSVSVFILFVSCVGFICFRKESTKTPDVERGQGGKTKNGEGTQVIKNGTDKKTVANETTENKTADKKTTDKKTKEKKFSSINQEEIPIRMEKKEMSRPPLKSKNTVNE